MSIEHTRAFLLTLPHVAETLQFGDNLVFWVGNKATGGRMFAMLPLAPDRHGTLAFAARPDRFSELTEREGIRPAAYLARASWVALESWSALPSAELRSLLREAHALVYGKLPKRLRDTLPLPLKTVE